MYELKMNGLGKFLMRLTPISRPLGISIWND